MHLCRLRPEDPEEKAFKDILDQIRMKVDLENNVKPAIAGAFSKLVGSFRRIWPSFQMMPPKFDHVDRFGGILKRHYRIVGRAFKDVASFGFRRRLTAEQKLIRDQAYQLWSDRRAPLQAGAIVDTSLRQMTANVRRSMMRLSAEGKPVTAETVARLAAETMRVDLGRRVPAIAIYETQSSAETLKLFEGQAAAGQMPAPLHGQAPEQPPEERRSIMKRWQTLEDERVRTWHFLANGQVRTVELPFLVGGQLLMSPGDRSLGATLANVMGCRCSPIFFEDQS